MSLVYFDRNVFADICGLRRGLTESSVASLKAAVDAHTIVIPSSYALIEETVALLRDSEEAYKVQIRTVLSLVDKARIIKPHHELIRDDCLSYAYGRSYARTTNIPDRFEDVLNVSLNSESLSRLAEEIEAFYEGITTERQTEFDQLIAEMKHRGFTGVTSFLQVWDLSASIILEKYVSRLPRVPRRLCQKHGLPPMLNIRSIRIATLYECWLLYSHWLRQDGSRGRIKPSEAGDFFHAVSASAADIFVTQEQKEKYGRLPFILSQLPIKGFTIMNLGEFLETLPSVPTSVTRCETTERL